MGQNLKHVLGRNLKFFTSEESTYGTFVTPVATDAVKTLSTSMEFTQERVDRADARATRSTLERITRRIESTWSAEMYAVPSGAAGTAPDCGFLLKSALGAETIVGATSAAYSLTSTQAMPSLSLLREANEIFSQRMNGAYTEEFSVSASGGDEPKFSFSGTGINVVNTGTSATTNGTTGTNVDVTAGEAENFATDSLINIADASGLPFTVSSIISASNRVTLSTSETWSTAKAITPYVPSETTAGSPVNGITGSVTLSDSAATFPITSFELTLANNIAAINDEAFTDKVTDFIPSFRTVTGSVTVRARKDQIMELNKRKTFSTRDLQVVLGSIAGSIITFDMDTVEFGFSPVDIPEADEATFTLPFTALGSGAGDNELTITFT